MEIAVCVISLLPLKVELQSRCSWGTRRRPWSPHFSHQAVLEWLSPRATDFAGKHVSRSLDQLNGLHYRTLDAGIVRKSEVAVPSGIIWRSGTGRRWSQRCRTIMSSPSRGRSAALRDQPFIMYPRESGIGLYWQVLRLCASAGFRPPIACGVQELTTSSGFPPRPAPST